MQRREVEEDDSRSTGPIWSFAWYFPAKLLLKNNNNRNDQMHKENKELYATVGKKNVFMYSDSKCDLQFKGW